jgi:hypothetical protein
MSNFLSLHDFLKSTGGGFGEYEDRAKDGKRQGTHGGLFRQYEWCSSPKHGLGFGRISFPSVKPTLYLRVPHESDPDMLMYFVENVWNVPRPKLLIGITGGAMDFPVSEDLEQVLNDLMQIARQNDAWIITGGTRVGIMKYIGGLTFFTFSKSSSTT